MTLSSQSRLQKTIGYYDNILDSLLQGVLFINQRGIVQTYNRTAEQILKIQRDKVLNQKFSDLFPDNLFGFSLKKALSKRQVDKTTFTTLDQKNMESLHVEITASFASAAPDKDRDKETDKEKEKEAEKFNPYGLLILINDIGEIRRSEQLNVRTDKMKEFGELAAMVAHEIRNPLGGIKGFASLLQRDLIEYPELHRLASYIVEGTDNLNRRVSDILDYTHSMQPSFEQIDLVQFTKDLILHLNADDRIDPRIELSTHSSRPKLIVPVDAAGLKSAILNLTSNAIQAMPEGGELSINLDADQNQAIIRVTDTGLGIPLENLEKIFSPFFTTRPKGHGLGLTEAKKIIHAHDGSLEVISEAGKGTSFIIFLPLHQYNHQQTGFAVSLDEVK